MTTPTTYPAVTHERFSPITDQGNVGSATGHAGAGLMGTHPLSSSVDEAAQYNYDYAVALYSGATRRDTLAGSYPPNDTGSSCIAVAKELYARSSIGGYLTGATVEALLEMLQTSPVMIGSVWLSYMDRPTAAGFVRVTGSVMGGHAYVCRAYEPGATLDDGVLTCSNCWGSAWGPLGGEFKLRIRDLRTLIARGIEMVGVVPTGQTPEVTPNTLLGS